MHAPRISVAMATYNGATFIGEQLASFITQSQLPDELVITDDGSTDDTMAMVEAFARTAPFPVSASRNPGRLGFNRNFERVLSLCTGDLILISDQDDVWYPQKIERAAAALGAASDKLALIHDEHIRDAGGRTLGGTYYGNARRLGYADRELLSGNCTALKRPLLDLLLPFPDGINYDYWIGWFADILDARIVLDEPLQLYRRHGNNASEPVLAEESPNHWSIFLRSGMHDPRPEWASNNRQLALIAGRIDEHGPAIDRLLGRGRARAALDRVSRETQLFDDRAQLVSLPKWKRWPAVINRLSNGWYANFTGYRSAIKDMIRP